MSIEISRQFTQVLDFINKTSRHVFLTGKAGSGKTTLLRYIRENTHKQLAVCAPTGAAAINAGGSTTHSFFQFPFTPFIPSVSAEGEISPTSKNLPVLKYNSQRLAIFRSLELLVIDEISMVRADMLDQIDITLRQTRRNWLKPFGGVQLLLIGDMYQLPPVVQQQEWELLSAHYKSLYFFDSYALSKSPPVYIELTKIYRQKEDAFINLLNKVRNNEMDAAALELLNSHYKADITASDYAGYVTLTTHNRKADEINSRNLDAIPGKAKKYKCEVSGLFPEKSLPADEELVLKVGTRVMFLKNNSEKNYYNGKIGIVTNLEDDAVWVKCDEDRSDIEVKRESWTNVTFNVDKTTKHISEDILGSFSQIPLRLAWAITIHKSQGLTFDRLIIDAAEAFSAGQVYVALSRCRSLAGLTLSSRISSSSLLNDTKILQFAATRHDEQQVTTIYNESQKKYFAELLLSLFDFSTAAEERKELAALAQLHAKRLTGADWTREFFSAIDQLYEISVRFRSQLDNLLSLHNDDLAEKKLQERVIAACVYFIGALDKVLDMLKQTTLRTESQECASDVNSSLQFLHDQFFSRKALMQSCQGGFDVQAYVEARLRIIYPTERVNIYASAKNSSAPAGVNYPALYRLLLLERDEICREEEKPAFYVATSRTIADLANFMPVDDEQLLSISGFGKARVAQFGERFLTIIKKFRHEHGLHDDFGQGPKKKKTKKKSGLPYVDAEPLQKKPTAEVTFEMYKTGLSPEEIARERKCTLATVLNHLLSYVKRGELSGNAFVSSEKVQKIRKVLGDLDQSLGLGAIKSQLPEEISYDDIRFVLADSVNQ